MKKKQADMIKFLLIRIFKRQVNLLIIIFISSNNAFSQTTNQIQQDIQAKQIIESERLELIRNKQAMEIENIKENTNRTSTSFTSEEFIDEKTCKIIKEFKISGNTKFKKWNLEQKFIKPLRKKDCFTKSDLSFLQKQISNHYLNNGYILTRVYFDSSELQKNIINIVIEEGKLEELKLNDNSKINNKLSFRRSLQKFFAFPNLNKNKVINLRDIEQGIDQFNRLGSNSAKMTIDAATKAGYSNIIVENNLEKNATISFSTDNSGMKNTGRIKRKVSLNYDNLIGINDNIYLNYSQSNATPILNTNREFNNILGINDNKSIRFSEAFYGSLSIPFGYYTIGGSYSYSDYLLTTTGTAGTMRSLGNSESINYYIEKVLLRGKKYKITLKSELSKNDTDSYLEDTYIPVNSRRTTESNFSINNIFYIPNGSMLIQPKYSKGLTAFGAMRDQQNLAKDKPKAQFETIGLYAQSNINFNIPKTTLPFNHKLTLDSVKSFDSLYGLDQFVLGGRYTVRGFQESIISGDNGYLVKNDLSFRVSDVAPKTLLNAKFANYSENFSISSALSKTRIGIFHDYGYVRNHIIDSKNDEGYMSGIGGILSYNGKFLNFDVIYSKSLHSPQFLRNIDGIEKDNETIYFSLGVNIGMI